MLRYFLIRLAGAVPTLFIIVTLTFFSHPCGAGRSIRSGAIAAARNHGQPAERLRPGSAHLDPVRTLPARAGARRFRAFVQVQGFLGDGAHRPGVSRDASNSGRSPWRWRLMLGIPIGTFAALHHNSAADYATMSLAVVGHRHSFVRGAAVSRFVVRHLSALAAGGRLGTRFDPASGAAGGRVGAAAAQRDRAAGARQACSRCCAASSSARRSPRGCRCER